MKQHWLKRFIWAPIALLLPLSAFADITDMTLTIPIGSSVNMETGAIVASGGDLKWDGISLTPQGGAKAAYVGPGDDLYQSETQQVLQTSAGPVVSTAAVPVGGLTGGSVIAVLTAAGHWGKLEVTTTSAPLNVALPIKITTFGATGGSGGPSISNVLNNSSEIPAGFPNSGISQGSLFKVLGAGLADAGDTNLHDSQAQGGLPTTLNNATINVQSGSTTVHPALYYSTPTQIDAVLPSSFPTGPANVIVNYKGSASNSFSINVVAAAPGITTFNGSGVAQHALTSQLVTYIASASPGEILILWGTGFGATGNSDTSYDTSAHQTSVPYTIYVGGLPADVAFKGASVYPGVDVFAVTVPQNVPLGCYVPVAAVANGNIVGNIVTLPIAASGGACSDPQLGLNGGQISSLSSIKSGFLLVSQNTTPASGMTSSAIGFFQQTAGVSAPGGGALSSIGGCVLTQTLATGSTSTTTPLSAGTITVTGPGTSGVTLTAIPQVPGFYSGTLPTIPSTGGAYVFTATAGSQVGAFTTTVNFPNPLLVWTNQAAAAAVNRSQGLAVAWTGGAPGTYVVINGTSTSGSLTGSYSCYVPQSVAQFTVPSYILLGLPVGSGTTTVTNSTSLTTFSATGLDFGASLGSVSSSVNSSVN